MAFFKFRKGGDAAPAAPAQAESVEAMRRRARHRLIGAAVLVLLGVVGFPLVFDTQPRPVSVDIPIEIPDRNKTRPLAPPVPAAQPVASAVVPPVPVAAPVPAAVPAPAAAPAPVPATPVAPARPEQAPAPRPDLPKPVPPRPEPRHEETRPASKAEVRSENKPHDDGARAQALLDGRPAQAASAAEAPRYIVQVGAFADPVKAREVRLKMEKAGLKTYTHVAETPDGKRIRVRVGPFPTKAEADKAAGRIKGLDLPAAILTL